MPNQAGGAVNPAHRPRRCEEGMMKDFGIKLICVLEASLAVYFAIGIGVSTLVVRFKFANVEFIIPGAFILVGIILFWITLLDRYPVCRRKSGVAIFLFAGLGLTLFISIAYPVLRTGALWGNPGELGGAAVFMIIFYSLVSQLTGFLAGYIPSALFVRRLARNTPVGKAEEGSDLFSE